MKRLGTFTISISPTLNVVKWRTWSIVGIFRERERSVIQALVEKGSLAAACMPGIGCDVRIFDKSESDACAEILVQIVMRI